MWQCGIALSTQPAKTGLCSTSLTWKKYIKIPPCFVSAKKQRFFLLISEYIGMLSMYIGMRGKHIFQLFACRCTCSYYRIERMERCKTKLCINCFYTVEEIYGIADVDGFEESSDSCRQNICQFFLVALPSTWGLFSNTWRRCTVNVQAMLQSIRPIGSSGPTKKAEIFLKKKNI